jgi:hypothetical protein
MNNRLDYFKLSPQASNKLVELTLHLSKKPLLADLAHLIMLRASQLNGCAFCVDMHVMASASCVFTMWLSGVSRHCFRRSSARRWSGLKP